MGHQKKWIKIVSIIWLIIIGIVAISSTMLWFIGWVMSIANAAELSVLTIFLSSYPVFVIVSIVIGWITFAKKKYLRMVLWSIFPIVWWLIFSTLSWLD